MSEHDILDLIDRAAIDAPHMHVSASHVVAGGLRKVRRRRVATGGMATGGLALAGLSWLAWGSGPGLTTAPDLEPAGQVWQDDRSVDASLFVDYQTIDPDQVGHTYDARMVREVADGPVRLELSDNGALVETVAPRSTVPGLDVYAGERMTVAVWVQPEGTLASVPLVGPYDEGGPSGARTIEVEGSLGYAVWSADVTTPPQEVRDVYLLGERAAVAVSGTKVDSQVMTVAGEDSLVFHDAERDVFGGDGEFGDSTGFVFDPVGDASVLSVSSGTEGRVRLLAVLPAGAGQVQAGSGGLVSGTDQVSLGGRTVVAATGEAPTSAEVGPSPISFELAGQRFDLDSYLADLFQLDVGDQELLPHTDARDHAALVLRNQQDKEVVRLTRDELDEGLVLTPTGTSVVIAAQGFDPGRQIFSGTRVELSDGGEGGPSRWVEPTDVAQVIAPWGEPVTLLTLPLPGDEVVRGVGVGEGDGDGG